MAKRQTLNVSKIKINPIEEPDRHFLRIYIPTYKRLQTQRTFAYLPDALRRRTVLVVSKEEAKILRPLGFPVLVCPLQGQGSVGHVRQWIIDNHDTERYGHKIVMMDDDVKFWYPNRAVKNARVYDYYVDIHCASSSTYVLH